MKLPMTWRVSWRPLTAIVPAHGLIKYGESDPGGPELAAHPTQKLNADEPPGGKLPTPVPLRMTFTEL